MPVLARHFVVLIPLTLVPLALFLLPPDEASLEQTKPHAAAEPQPAARTLKMGDVLLVGIKPVTDADFRLVGPTGATCDGVSFEHVGADRRLAFLIHASGEHQLRLETQGNDKRKGPKLQVDVVPATLSADEKLDRLVQHFDSDRDPGAVLTVSQAGTTSMVLNFGCANVEHRVRVRGETVFDTASMAKHVTGVVIAKLARDGKLSLDDDIRKHIPEVPNFGETISIRHLLYHTSGLRDFPGLMVLGDWHDYDVITLDQVVELVRNQQDLNFAPGTQYAYSNTGYSLLAETVQRVTGDSLAVWADKHLFGPLEMKNTRFLEDIRAFVPNRAAGYSLAGPNALQFEPNNLAAMGSSSFLTTGSDMLAWQRNFDAKLVASDALSDMMSVQGKLTNGESIDYGFGIGHGDYRGLRKLEHGGASGGFRSHLLRFPDQQFSVCVLTNQGSFDPASLAHFAADLYLADNLNAPPKTSIASTESQSVKASASEGKVEVADLDAFAGTYQIHPNEVISITREGTKLLIRPKGHPEVTPIIAEPITKTRFTGPPGGSLEFVANEQGTVTKALMRQGEQIIGEAKRLEGFRPTLDDLSKLEGRYFSRELDVHYDVSLEDDVLVSRQPKRARTWNPVTKDRFKTNDGITIEVVRDAGTITGFLATTGSRVRNVRFVRE